MYHVYKKVRGILGYSQSQKEIQIQGQKEEQEQKHHKSRVQHLDGSLLFQKETKCIFAPTASIFEHNKTWVDSDTIEKNVEELIPDLNKYVNHVKNAIKEKSKPIDCFGIEAPAKIYSKDLNRLSELLRRVLTKINKDSVEEIKGLEVNKDGSVTGSNWYFTYKDIPFFVVTSSPLYNDTHSRFSGGERQSKVVIHLQPIYSFEYRFKNLLNGVTPEERINAIRNRFDNVGRNYHNGFDYIMGKDQSGVRYHEAARYIKPLKKGDPSVDWWKQKQNVKFILPLKQVDNRGKEINCPERYMS